MTETSFCLVDDCNKIDSSVAEGVVLSAAQAIEDEGSTDIGEKKRTIEAKITVEIPFKD